MVTSASSYHVSLSTHNGICELTFCMYMYRHKSIDISCVGVVKPRDVGGKLMRTSPFLHYHYFSIEYFFFFILFPNSPSLQKHARDKTFSVYIYEAESRLIPHVKMKVSRDYAKKLCIFRCGCKFVGSWQNVDQIFINIGIKYIPCQINKFFLNLFNIVVNINSLDIEFKKLFYK